MASPRTLLIAPNIATAQVVGSTLDAAEIACDHPVVASWGP
jgi:hypothetical protein